MMRSCVAVGWIFAVALFPATVSCPDLEAFVRERHCSNPMRKMRHVSSAWRGGADVAHVVRAKCGPGLARSSPRSSPNRCPRGTPRANTGRWANDRRLSQAEIDKIVAWVDAGAPRGTEAIPAPPQFAEGGIIPAGNHRI